MISALITPKLNNKIRPYLDERIVKRDSDHLNLIHNKDVPNNGFAADAQKTRTDESGSLRPGAYVRDVQ